MRRHLPGRGDPWLYPLVAGVAAFALALGVLAVVLLDAATGEPSAAAPALGATATPVRTATEAPSDPVSPESITYAGPLPAVAEALGLSPAAPGAVPDVVFDPEDGSGEPIAIRRWTPVAAFGAGIDAIASGDLAAIARGEITDWAELGGIAGPARFAVAGSPDEVAAATALLPGAAPVEAFATVDELYAAMTIDGGLVAFVPLTEVRPSAMALAIDGVDLVRGEGDPTAWPYVEVIRAAARTPAGEAVVAAMAESLARLPEPITVVATGDILQVRCSLAAIEATGDWAAAFRGPVGDYLAAADLALGSIDGAIQDIAEPYRCEVTTNLSSPPEVIEGLLYAGFDEVTIATNHIFDCGVAFCGTAAFTRTIELLNEAGIVTVGGGANLEEALAPAIFEVRGTTFGILGFDDVAAMDLEATDTTPGTAPLDDDYSEERAAGEPAFFRPAEELGLERFTSRIRTLAAEVDVVIVQVQSGTENTHDPSPRSIKALRAAVEAGATLVVGNQAHHVQAIEPLSSAFIAYALGNFVYDQVELPGHTQGYLLEATFWESRLAAVRLVPYQIEEMYKPVFVEGDSRNEILADVFDATLTLIGQ